MKKNLILMVLSAIIMLIANFTCKAGKTEFFEDTIWTKKTDLADGFFYIKFSTNDSIIVGSSTGVTIFFKTSNGEEIKRISGSKEIFFINGDKNFIRLNEERQVFEIFDSKTYKVIDSLESDGTIINEYPIIDISKDGKYLIAPIPKGFRIWDVSSKKILKTKIFPDEPNLLDVGVDNIRFVCGNEKIIAQFGKIYNNPDDPENPITIGSFIVWDFNSLDSIDSYSNSRGFKLSNTCKYIVYSVSDTDSGVVIYDFLKKEIVQKLAINGYTLTGIEFSPDDKYIVTSSGPDANCMLVWEITKDSIVYTYPYGSFSNIAISNNGNFIASTTGRYFFMWNFKNGITGIKEETNKIAKIIYPNPTNNIVTIEFELKSTENVKIDLTNTNGEIIKNIFNHFLEAGNQKIEINTSDIAAGYYYIVVKNEIEQYVFQLVVLH